MPSVYGQRPGRHTALGETVVLEGLVPLQRALRLAQGDADKHLRKRLRLAAEPVKQAAKGNITHKWPKRGTKPLESTIKVGVNVRSVSVYSAAPQAAVQDVGGGPHMGWAHRGPHVQRGNASHYMTRAVQQTAVLVGQELERVLDDLARDFES